MKLKKEEANQKVDINHHKHLKVIILLHNHKTLNREALQITKDHSNSHNLINYNNNNLKQFFKLNFKFFSEGTWLTNCT